MSDEEYWDESGAWKGPRPLPPSVQTQRNTADYDDIVCLEDGEKRMDLGRYLQQKYGMTPDAFRRRWGLLSDYPMIAPNHTTKRAELAAKIKVVRRR